MRKLFLDLDGVLADFDLAYFRAFGAKLEKDGDEDPPGFWENIRGRKNFFLDLPFTPDAMDLWNGVSRLAPTILTGAPLDEVPEAEAQKREWVASRLGPDVKVTVCRSTDKHLHGKPGDVLVDDRPKHRAAWEKMGGVWVTHVSAEDTLKRLRRLGMGGD